MWCTWSPHNIFFYCFHQFKNTLKLCVCVGVFWTYVVDHLQYFTLVNKLQFFTVFLTKKKNHLFVARKTKVILAWDNQMCALQNERTVSAIFFCQHLLWVSFEYVTFIGFIRMLLSMFSTLAKRAYTIYMCVCVIYVLPSF